MIDTELLTLFNDEVRGLEKLSIKDRRFPEFLVGQISLIEDEEMVHALGHCVGCVIKDNDKDYVPLTKSCWSLRNPSDRFKRCQNRILLPNQEKCKLLYEAPLPQNYFSAILTNKTYSVPEREIVIPNGYDKTVKSWLDGGLRVSEGPVVAIPEGLRKLMLSLASEGLGLFENVKICGESHECTGECKICVDGLLRNQYEPRSAFYEEEMLPRGRRKARDCIVPAQIERPYGRFGDDAVSRLQVLSSVVNQAMT